MGKSFATSDSHPQMNLQPLRVPILQRDVFSAAKELIDDLPDWTLDSADEESLTLVCTRAGGALSGASRITITIEGPEGMPSSTVNCRSESEGGLLSRDKKNVLEFMRPFHRRIC